MNNNILSDYEEKYNIKIPNEIRFCINNGVFKNLIPHFYDEKEDFIFPIVSSLKYEGTKNVELYITELVNIKNLENYINAFDVMVNYHRNFFPISFGVMPYSSWLLVGINNENKLQVWITAPGGGDDLVLLCDDLFLFLDNCCQVFNPEIKTKNLYQNYEEDFWRIKY